MALYDNKPKEVAAALKQMHQNMMAAIKPEELNNMDLEKRPQNSPNIVALTKIPALIGNNARDDIMLAENQKKQQKIYNFYVKLMDESIKAGDFDTALALVATFNSPAITRLDYLNKDKKTNLINKQIKIERTNLTKK